MSTSPPVLLYRIGNYLYRKRLTRTAKTLSWMNRLLFATFIPSSAIIGRNFTVAYWGLGVVIHSHAKIGDNCWISQNVTIGRKGNDKLVPVIGNNVYVGVGAVIVGEITIGDNSVIGANSYVSRSIPSYSLAFGIPATVKRSIRNESRYEIDRMKEPECEKKPESSTSL